MPVRTIWEKGAPQGNCQDLTWRKAALNCLSTFKANAKPMDDANDEPVRLCGGLERLRNFRFGITPESRLLPQAWADLPARQD